MLEWLRRPLQPIPDLTVIIPTWNAATYIDIFLEYYIRNLRIPVIVFIDSKTTDGTPAVAKRFATEIVQVPNPDTMVEAIIETISRACRTKWILRIDDDELPTLGLMECVRRIIAQGAVDACGFPRFNCAISKAGRLVRHRGFDAIADKQFRLYQRERVRYTTLGHMPGFHIEGLRTSVAPSEAAMIHLDWAVHSFERRKEKFWRYEARTPGHGSIVPGLILYEEDPAYRTRFDVLEIPELARTVRRLRRRFPELCVDTSA